MNFPQKQRGLSFAGWIFLLLIFGSAMTLGLKLVPAYMDHNTMANVLDGIASEDGHALKPISMIQDLVKKRFKLNNIREFDFKENMKVEAGNNGTTITLDYEVRMNVARNLDLIATFNKQVELRK